MKKIVFAIMFAAMLMISSATNYCLANLPDDEFALGGIPVGSSVDYLKRVYGEPSQVIQINDPLHRGVARRYIYGEGLFFETSDNTIIRICVYTNNKIKTPLGVGVGDAAYRALETYGNPDDKIRPNVSWVDKQYYDTIIYDSNKRNGKAMKILLQKVNGPEKARVREIQVAFFD